MQDILFPVLTFIEGGSHLQPKHVAAYKFMRTGIVYDRHLYLLSVTNISPDPLQRVLQTCET
jgi:hypothetical protein